MASPAPPTLAIDLKCTLRQCVVGFRLVVVCTFPRSFVAYEGDEPTKKMVEGCVCCQLGSGSEWIARAKTYLVHS